MNIISIFGIYHSENEILISYSWLFNTQQI